MTGTDLSANVIREALNLQKTGPPINLIFLQSIESTNAFAFGLAANGCPEGTVVIANAQTGGKGRLGRNWFSPPDVNLYLSIVLRPSLKPREATLLTLASAVASCRALRTVSGLPVAIKWPNDIIVADRKAGGILTDLRVDRERITYAVVGIGININLPADLLPAELKDSATSLMAEAGASFSRNQIAVELLEEVVHWHHQLAKGMRTDILNEWSQLSTTIGRPITISFPHQLRPAFAAGIDEEGLLIVEFSDGTRRKINAGDVNHAQPIP